MHSDQGGDRAFLPQRDDRVRRRRASVRARSKFETRGPARAVDDGMRGGVVVGGELSAGSQCMTARGLYRYIVDIRALARNTPSIPGRTIFAAGEGTRVSFLSYC